MIFLNITHLNDFWKSYLIGNANRINDNYMLVNGNEYLYKYKSLKRLDLDTNFPNVLNRFIESVKGDYDGIIGLPVSNLMKTLQSFNI